MAMRRFLFILAVIASGGTAAAQEDLVAAGEKVFVKCKTCHLVGAPTKFVKSSPHLNGLFGRKPGGLPDFKKYSDALVAFGQDKVWDEATLTTFLRDPQGVVRAPRWHSSASRRTRRLRPCSPIWRRSTPTEWPQNRTQPEFKL